MKTKIGTIYQSQSIVCLMLATGLLFCGMFPGSASASAITPERVVELVNTDRGAGGLAPLHIDTQLAAAAEAKAGDMVLHDYFAHTSPEGRTPWNWIEGAGYDYRYAGENLAIRFTGAEEEQSAWMASPTHRANIMSDRFVDIGVAVEAKQESGHPVLVVVQEFGTRPGVALPLVAKPVGTATQDTSLPTASLNHVPADVPIVTSSWWFDTIVDGRIHGISLAQLSLMFFVSLGELLSALVFGRSIRRHVHQRA